MTWFKQLTGFEEIEYHDTQSKLRVEGQRLYSNINQASWQIGRLETPSLHELRQRTPLIAADGPAKLKVSHQAADAYELHAQTKAKDALIQVASQFNLLEMADTDITPEEGITQYEYDFTQGPACAMAAAGAAIYRNYFAPVGNQTGQTKDLQIDTFADLRNLLPCKSEIKMQNGYVLMAYETIQTIAKHLQGLSESDLDHLRGQLRIGLHWNVEVTAPGPAQGQTVSQAYCSALPVSYNPCDDDPAWEPLARLVLEAAYEATLLAALQNAAEGRSKTVYLTLLGGGAFGNQTQWILGAIERALDLVKKQDLNVVLVGKKSASPALQDLIEKCDSRPPCIDTVFGQREIR